jgi:hypothetical protein
MLKRLSPNVSCKPFWGRLTVQFLCDSVRIRRGCERPRFGHSRPPYWQQRFAEAGVDGLLRTRLDTAGGKSDVQAVGSTNSFLRR